MSGPNDLVKRGVLPGTPAGPDSKSGSRPASGEGVSVEPRPPSSDQSNNRLSERAAGCAVTIGGSPLAVYGAIRDELRMMPELRKLPWRDHPHPLGGHCYVAVEAFCALVPGAKPRHVYVPVREGESVSHWYAVRNGLVYDPTWDQFDVPVPYTEGRGCGFLTKEPSKRTRALLSRLKEADAK